MAATRVDTLIALFLAEWRSARRSAGVWIAAACTVGVGFALYTRFAALQAVNYAPPPRFATPSLGLVTLWAALLGLILLVPGLRARDVRANIAEALDARPVSNLALLLGRLAGVVLPAWLSLALLGGLLQITGLAAEQWDWRALGEALEPIALVTFLALDAPPTLLFWGGLALLLSAAMPGRGAVAAVLVTLLALAFFGVLRAPMHLLPALAGITSLGLPGSEILPRHPAAMDFAQRLALVVLAAGCLAAAATLLTRRDDSSRRRLRLVAVGLVLIGAGGIGTLVAQAIAANAERREWAAAHLALRGAPRVDVERLTGTVEIDPGRALTLDLRLHVRVPDEAAGGPMRFSLNPGLAVSSVTVNGEPAAYDFHLGLLTVPQSPSDDGAERIVGIRAGGLPDARFAYPDTAVAAMEESLAGHPLALLGDQAMLFEEDFVALLPGGHWLPRADVNFSASLESAGDVDHRAIDLQVRVPPGWHAAGAGRDAAADGLRFRPAAPLAEFALLAAPWRRYNATIGGVEFELLVHPKHAPQVDRVRPFVGPLIAKYESTLRSLTAQGLPYSIAAPSGPVFSVVEAPAALRRYGGGRQMLSLQGLPGVQLLPEQGFPTVRLQVGSLERSVFVLDYGNNYGANTVPLYVGVWRNLLHFHTNATGEAATPLNLLLNNWTSRRFGTGEGLVFAAAQLGPLRAGRHTPIRVAPMRVLHRLFGAVHIFYPAMWKPGSAFGELVMSADQVAVALEGGLSVSGVGEFLAALRNRHGGATFALSDFMALLDEHAPQFAPVIRVWLAGGGLPGYLAAPVEAYRLPDDERGETRYQLRLHVRNDEPVPGVVRLVWRVKGELYNYGAPVPVPANAAVELGAILRHPPHEVQLDTFLSRNRGAVRLGLPRLDPERAVAREPLAGARASDWRPRAVENLIVVDDLDSAFSTRSVVTAGLRFTRREVTATGPEVSSSRVEGERRWRRIEDSMRLAWGRYRRSLVTIEPGTGESQATFAATLPSAGRWRLAYHLPGNGPHAGTLMEDGPFVPIGGMPRYGMLDVHIEAGGERHPAPFDAGEAVPGWNRLGTFDLPAGEVRVTVSDRTSGDSVPADAIRWLPADEESSAAEQ